MRYHGCSAFVLTVAFSATTARAQYESPGGPMPYDASRVRRSTPLLPRLPADREWRALERRIRSAERLRSQGLWARCYEVFLAIGEAASHEHPEVLWGLAECGRESAALGSGADERRERLVAARHAYERYANLDHGAIPRYVTKARQQVAELDAQIQALPTDGNPPPDAVARGSPGPSAPANRASAPTSVAEHADGRARSAVVSNGTPVGSNGTKSVTPEIPGSAVFPEPTASPRPTVTSDLPAGEKPAPDLPAHASTSTAPLRTGDAFRALVRAEVHAEEGDFVNAVRGVRELLVRYPNDVGLLERLLLWQVRIPDCTDAYDAYQRLVTNRPNAPIAVHGVAIRCGRTTGNMRMTAEARERHAIGIACSDSEVFRSIAEDFRLVGLLEQDRDRTAASQAFARSAANYRTYLDLEQRPDRSWQRVEAEQWIEAIRAGHPEERRPTRDQQLACFSMLRMQSTAIVEEGGRFVERTTFPHIDTPCPPESR